MKNRFAALCFACALAAGPLGVSYAQRATEPITLNFVNADIDAVARTMAAIIGRNIVVDPRVKGTVNLSTDRPVSPTAAYNQFLATLRLNGFTVVDSGGLLKVVPEADAKLQGGAVSVGTPAAGGEIVTQIFRLNYEPAANLVPILRPLISPNNTINVNPGNNSLVITDYSDNLQRLAKIIAALDVANATDVDVIPLHYGLAPDMAPIVQRLIDASAVGAGGGPAAAGQVDTSFRTTIIPESRSNSLLVRAANPARLNLVRSIVMRLDQPGSDLPSGNIHVVYLKNAEAARLAVTLRAALAATTPGGAGGGGAVSSPTPGTTAPAAANSSPATAPTQGAAQPSTGGQIQADPATNALIITAPEPQYRQLRAVIDQLDERRAQVYVESLIAEVNANKAAEFGIQWQDILGSKGGNIGVLGTNFSIGGTNILGVQQAISSGGASGQAPATGVNLGLVRHTNGVYMLAALARFLETNADGNVLSTPNLLTLDNEEAKIVIGQNVPFVTGQYTNANVGTGGTVNPFQTIERKDVGITLRVRPQISENGTVRMQIFQEVSSVDPASLTSPQGITTNKRSIESNVLVQDGGIVVLGGLLQDQYSGNEQKVPGVGDIPLLGNLFKAETRSRNKTNLMVFLRPVILRDAPGTDQISLDRYDLMRGMQGAAQPKSSLVVPINASPIMPDVPPRRAPAAPAPSQSQEQQPAAPAAAPAAAK
jgi:general secretion pathway protein D